MSAQEGSRVTVSEAAELVGRSVNTIRRWIADGRLRTKRVLGRVYFDRSELELLAQQPDLPSPKRTQRKK